jgi:hypothetical protein
MNNATKYFQRELDWFIKRNIIFQSTKIVDVWLDDKNLMYYCKIVHGGEDAFWQIDKNTIDLYESD